MNSPLAIPCNLVVPARLKVGCPCDQEGAVVFGEYFVLYDLRIPLVASPKNGPMSSLVFG